MNHWLCIGGPLHGQYRPASDRVIAVQQTSIPVDYVYYPGRIVPPGWRFQLSAYVLGTGADIPVGTVLPGGVQGAPIAARVACRWCYGRPMEGLDVCSRVSCIQNVAWLQAADSAVASDAEGWHGDRP